MDGAPFDALARALAPGERTRRETLRLLAGAGAGLASLAALADAEAKNKKKKRKKRKKRKKKKFKGDARCKNRNVFSSNGICVDNEDPDEVFAALCNLQCICVLDTKGARACVSIVEPLCEGECDSDDDCVGAEICVDIAGCCVDDPGIVRTCALPCPSS